MVRKEMGSWRWCKLWCLFVVGALLFAGSAETAFMQEMVPLATPRAQQVVGGEDAEVGEFPWQGWFTFRTPTGMYSCGASLIHPKWVLTAAHCTRNAQIGEVLLGAHTMSDSADPGRQVVSVREVHPHPNFNGWTNDNDLALLELETAVIETERVRPITIVNDSSDLPLYAPGELSIVTGWGALSEGGSAANTLQKVELPIVEYQTCNEAYGGDVTENMMCAGYPEGGKDSCQGDSGGPLIVSDGSGGWKQAGIVSWGVGCARPELYGVYTKLANYAEWLKSTTNGDLPYSPTLTPTPAGTLTETPTAAVTSTALPTGATATPTDPATAFPSTTATPSPDATTTVAPSLTPTPSGTPSATPTTIPTPNGTSAPVATIANGNFNAGPNGAWVETSMGQYGPGILIRDGETIPATDGVEGYAVWMGSENSTRSTLAQTVTVPSAAPIALIFDYEIQAGGECGHSTARVQTVDPQDAAVAATVLAVYDLCAATSTGGWQTALLDLAPLAGQTLALQFIVERDAAAPGNFFLDNVAFTSQVIDGLASGPGGDDNLIALAAQPGVQNIALDWAAPHVASVARYRVLRRNGQGAFAVLGEVAETHFIDSHDPSGNVLNRGEEYCYVVEPLDAAGKSLGESNRACAVSGQLALSVPELVGRPGETLAVPIRIQNAEGAQVTAAELWLDVDPRVLSVRDVAAAPLSVGKVGWSYSETTVSESVRRLRINALPHETDTSEPSGAVSDFVLHGSGTLFWLFFDVVGDAGTTSALALQGSHGADSGSTLQVQDEMAGAWSVPLVLQSGSVEIVAKTENRATLGDITGEGTIDDADIDSLLQFTTQRTGLTVPQRLASDVTGDSKINAADAALLYHHTLTGGWTVPAPLRSVDASTQVDTTVALTGSRSNAGNTITTTLQITNADNMAGADLLIAYDPDVVADVVAVTLGGALQTGSVAWFEGEHGFLHIALATSAPIDGDALLIQMVWRLAENIARAEGPAEIAYFSLLDVHLSDGVGRDFVTGFANHTLRGESASIPLSPALSNDKTIFLPTIMQPDVP